MPISRCELRNEYSLADPELYRAADKDDPEALLEGVAMAGLVGVLRQLGDLAEFAAEIFHNLHEEVMATAARGHGLMIRIQQLETEVPSIERAFLSQTDHSSFFNHPVVDWHPNLRIEQNLVTQGDLPRFIMDSYEECRAPPRLFLLDKFDVAGAGACLKRYTDPSFFKVETSGRTDADVPREKKIRKPKKKGPRWKNGETTEVLPTSHTKLHQLFLQEERIENSVSSPTRRAKLKRRLNGFPFNSKTEKSYMEKILKCPSPDNKVVHEVTVNSSPLMPDTFDHNKSGLELVEVRPVCPDRENVGRNRSPPSPDREESLANSSIYELSEVAIDDKICKVPNLYPSITTHGGISFALDKVTGEKVIAVDAGSHREGILTDYQSDGISSEVDNYVDATSTVESDTDADSRLRVKSDFTSSHIKNEPMNLNANEENLQIRSFDSQSTGDSTISDEGNNSSRKEMSTFSSDSPSTSAANPQSERISVEGFSSADIHEVDEIVDDASSNLKTAAEDYPVAQHSEPTVYDDHNSEYEQAPSGVCSCEPIDTSLHPDSGVVGKGMLEGPKLDKTDSTLDDEEKKPNLVSEPPCSPLVFDSDLQSGESIASISTVPYIHMADSSGKVNSELLHGDQSDQEDRSVENIAFKFNNVHSQNKNGTPNEMTSSESLISGKLDDEFRKLPNDFPSDYPDIVHDGDNIKSMISTEKNLINGLDDECSDVSTDSQKLEETSSINAQSIDAEDNHINSSIDNQICSENLVLSHLTKSSDWPRTGLDTHEGNLISDEDTTLNEIFALGTPKSCEVLAPLDTRLTHHVSPNDSEAHESSSTTTGELKEPAGTSGSVEVVTEISGSTDLKSLNEVHIPLDEPESVIDGSNTADMASFAPAVSDNLIMDDIASLVGLDKLVEEHFHFVEDSGIDQLENDKNCVSGTHGESGLVEKVDQAKECTSGSETVLCNTTDSDTPKLEVSGTVPNTHLDLEVDQDLNLDREHETANHMSNDYESEDSIVQEEIGSLPSQLDQDLLRSREISSEVSPVLPINHQETLNHDDLKGDNYLELPRLSNPLDSIIPPSSPFSETNEINLADSPPLPPLPPVQWMTGKLQHASSSLEGNTMKPGELVPQLISCTIVSTDDAKSSPSSLEEMKHSLIQIANKPAAKDEKVESYRVEVNSVHETIDLPPKSEVMPTSESESTSAAEEDGVANGSRTGKLPRPRHPLIDEFSALDKSKLRKVTERVMPQRQKVDERDSLLEQIRTKSFNLKPTLASRPSIRGPNTNLKVAAIVEKANAIRQALAGSDEDDDDSWSDS